MKIHVKHSKTTTGNNRDKTRKRNRVRKRRNKRNKWGGDEEKQTKRKREYDDVTTMFFDAIKGGNIDEVQSLLDDGVVQHANVLDSQGYNAAFWLAGYGYPEILTFLIDRGLNINGSGRENIPMKITPLTLSIRNNNKPVTTILIQRGADVNVKSQYTNGATPLMEAIRKGDMETMRELIGAGADVNLGDNNGTTPLLLAADSGDHAAVSLLLGAGANVDGADIHGVTPLHRAAGTVADDAEIVINILIDAGADVNSIDDDDNTPISNAVSASNPTSVTILLKAGASNFTYDDINEKIQAEIETAMDIMEEYSGDQTVVQEQESTIESADEISVIFNTYMSYSAMIPADVPEYTGTALTREFICSDIYDAISMKTFSTDDILKSNDILICIYNNARYVVSRRELEGELETNVYKLVYMCHRVSPAPEQPDENIVTDPNGIPILYFNMAGVAIHGVMVPVASLKRVVNDTNVKAVFIDTSTDNDLQGIPITERPVTSLLPFHGGNIVSATHCQANETIRVGSLRSVNTQTMETLLSSCPTQGGTRASHKRGITRNRRPSRRFRSVSRKKGSRSGSVLSTYR